MVAAILHKWARCAGLSSSYLGSIHYDTLKTLSLTCRVGSQIWRTWTLLICFKIVEIQLLNRVREIVSRSRQTRPLGALTRVIYIRRERYPTVQHMKRPSQPVDEQDVLEQSQPVDRWRRRRQHDKEGLGENEARPSQPSQQRQCDAPIPRVQRRHCDVYTQVRNTLTYVR